jgi:asparagine synthase (glutamine-hydrolysing)
MGSRELVERMTCGMAHRGPDDTGYYEDGDARLGHRRLSILDLSSAGRQPMVSEDGRLAVTFNGAIYNFRQLRAELERTGCRFRSGTDTEVLLWGYERWGPAFLDRIEGMFALGLWDGARRRLVLARDRTGIKPLFYTQRDGGLAFASELKALLIVPGVERRVNRRALRSAVRYASNLEDESMLAGVFKLPPGFRLIWQDGAVECGPYWRAPEPRPEAWREEDAVAELRKRLRRTVESHMLSDAPLGAALSGGLDSSGIVALMAKASSAPVETFTVGHGEDDPDLLSARIVAGHCRTNHHEVLVSAGNVADLLPALVWHLEEPLGQMESVQMYLNYREAARHVKVLLIGEGADECFGGYSRYKLLDTALPLAPRMRRELYHRVYMYADEEPRSAAARALAWALWDAPAPSPLTDPYPRAAMPALDGAQPLERALDHDRRTYLHHLSLKRADALGMAHSLELRVPYVDRDIVEFAARLPASLLLRRGREKYILRQALAPLLPPGIAGRRKRGLQMRLELGLEDALDYLCDRLLRPDDVRARGFFDLARVQTLRRGRPRRLATPMAHKVWSYRVWSVLLCELWARIFLDRPPSAGAPARLADVL